MREREKQIETETREKERQRERHKDSERQDRAAFKIQGKTNKETDITDI